jgi:hypothetical protein
MGLSKEIKILIEQQRRDDKSSQHRQYITIVKNPPHKELLVIRKRACITLHQQGYSIKSISVIFNLTERAIYSYLHY